MATRPGVDRYRCVGTLDGPLGDCRRRPTKGLFCYGIIEESGQVHAVADLEQLAEEPVPVIITACSRHMPAIIAWAEALWSDIAEGLVVPIGAVDDLRVEIGADEGQQFINPDPAFAVGVQLLAG